MFGFNRNNDGGPIGRLFKGTSFDYTNNRYNRNNNYDNNDPINGYNNSYDNNGPFNGYNNRMRDENFIIKYVKFRIILKIVGAILGLLFVMFILSRF